MQMITSFPGSVWTPTASDLWRIWNRSKLARRPVVAFSSDVEEAEFLLSALSVESRPLHADA